MRSIVIKMVHGLVYSAPIALLALAACGGGGGSGTSIIQSLLSGTTSGLTSNGLVLRNSVSGAANDDVNVSGVISGVTGFTFSQQVAQGSTYNVSVLTQPSSPSRQSCEVTSGASGVMPATNVSSVTVDCVDVFGARVGVYNLTSQGLILQNDYAVSGEIYPPLPHSDVLAVSSGNPLATRISEFDTLLPASTVYEIHVFQQPNSGLPCWFTSTASSVSATAVTGIIGASDVTFSLNCDTVPP